MFQVQVQGGFKVQVRVLCGLGFRVELRVRVSGQGFREFFLNPSFPSAITSSGRPRLAEGGDRRTGRV